MQKKIMMLGANHVQTTAIIAAKKEDYEVITVDNKPDNLGHQYADYSYNISKLYPR